MFKPTPEKSAAHFKKIHDLESKIRFKKVRAGGVIGDTQNSISSLLNEYESAIQEKRQEVSGGLMEYLENNELPSDILFHALGPEKYYEITHNRTSPYSSMYYGEIGMLLDLADNKSQYIHKNIIDIGCGDGIKVYAMLQEAIKNQKIEGTVDYLGLDDSKEMLAFAKDNFYKNFYSKTQNKDNNFYISSDDIHPINKKIRPWFKKARFQKIDGLDKMTPKTMLFLWWTFWNLGDFKQGFLDDIKNMLQKDDIFIVSYFRILDQKWFENPDTEELIQNFFEREKKLYEKNNRYYHEKEIDIKNFKNIMPGLNIGHDDFDVHMELDKENNVLYDVRTFKKDIIYQGEVVIPKWSYKSGWTNVNPDALRKQYTQEDPTKTFTESLYATKETEGFIHEFLKFRGVDPQDCFINEEYKTADQTLYITIEAKDRPITFTWEEDAEKKSITKQPGEVITLHKSKRFTDQEMKNLVDAAWLTVVDEIWCPADIAGQDTMKLLIIKKK